MRERLRTILRVETNQIAIKATTTERLGFIGREEGVLASAVVLLQRCRLAETPVSEVG
jgi:2-C-methyl-D-erythritol 2,4-cyclodiphosphate synthase